MRVQASNGPRLDAASDGIWLWRGWASGRIVAGVTDRHADPARLADRLQGVVTTVGAEQVSGSSVSMIGPAWGGEVVRSVPGCDALLTNVAGTALLIRSADCLPIVFADPARGVVGIAHAGWRGLAASLPARVVAAFRHAYHSHSRELRVAIGPGIRSCCYEVGPEFHARFTPFVHERGKRTCDLIGVALDQLRRCGIRPDRVTDAQVCTSCETERWFSLRREGPSTGRLTSFIMVRP